MGLHIFVSSLAFSLLAVAALLAWIVAIQSRHLRHHQPMVGFMLALPPLETMEGLLFRMIWFGEAVLTLALLSGAVFVENLLSQHLAHKTFLTLLAWLVFAILLAGRHLGGWRGKTAIRWTIVGFSVLLLGYLGSKFVLEVILHRH